MLLLEINISQTKSVAKICLNNVLLTLCTQRMAYSCGVKLTQNNYRNNFNELNQGNNYVLLMLCSISRI